MFESLARAAVAVATTPIAAVADAVTLGGSLTDQRQPYTATAASDVIKNLQAASAPKE